MIPEALTQFFRRAFRPIPLALLLVALLWTYVFTYSVRLNNPNERTRVLQTRALVDQGHLRIGASLEDPRGRRFVRDLYGNDHRGIFVNDVAIVCEEAGEEPPDCTGGIYPAKAPGAAVLGAPVLWVAERLGFVGQAQEDEAKVTWVLRYGGVALPMLLALWVLSLLLRRMGFEELLIAKVIFATGLGTSIFPYAIMFVGHALAGACLLVGVYLLERARQDAWPHLWAVAGGFVASCAVLMEYHAAIAVAVVGLWTLLSPARRRLLPGFVAGAMLAFGLHALLHIAMFGSPFKTGHYFLASAHNRDSQSDGFMGIDGFHFAALIDNLLDPYMGLLPLMPWLFVGAWAGIPKLLQKPQGQLSLGAGRVLAAIPLVYLLFVSMLGKWRVMNGWSIGPRYLLPAMLPLAFVAAVGWHHMARRGPVQAGLIRGLAGASMIIIAALTVVYPQPPAYIHNPFVELAMPLLDEGVGVRNIGLSLGLGAASLKPFFVLLLLLVGWVGLSCGAKRQRALRSWLIAGVIAITISWGWVKLMERWPLTQDPRRVEQGQDFVRDTAEGFHPEREAVFWRPAK